MNRGSGSNYKILLRLFVFLVLGASAASVWPPAARSQEGLNWFNPRLGQLTPRLSYRATFYPSQTINDRGDDLGLVEHDFSLTYPAWQTEDQEMALTVAHRSQHFYGGEIFENALYDVELGGVYRRRLQNGWLGGLNLSLGSASDRPFDTWDETIVSSTAFARVPHAGSNAWLFLINYSNRRSFWNHIPLPGFGYWYQPHPRLVAVFGAAFFYLWHQPLDDLTLSAAWFPIRVGMVRAAHRLWGPSQLYVAFESNEDNYFLAERVDVDDRLFYYELRLKAGLRAEAASRFTLDLWVGYAFDRYYFEGEDYFDDEDRMRVGSGLVFSGMIGLRF